MARCDHATMAWRRAGKGSDILGLAKRDHCPEGDLNHKLFSLEKGEVNCFSCVLYNCSLRVQLFWSWPHILLAKAWVDTIYGVVWGSMLSNAGWNHKGELSGPNRVDLISMEDWTNSPQTACFGCGYSTAKNETRKFFSFIVSGMWSVILSFEDLSPKSYGQGVWGSTFWKWTRR